MPIPARGCAPACAALAAMTLTAAAQEMPIPPATPPAKRIVTHGLAAPTIDNLFKCEVPVTNHRISAMDDHGAGRHGAHSPGRRPSFRPGRNSPTSTMSAVRSTPQNFADARFEDVPIVEIDKDGEVVTGFVIADNYFELYVNGKLVAVDPVPFTPFNSPIVRFRAKRPTPTRSCWWTGRRTWASAWRRCRTTWHSGDGGIVAKFSDGTVTD